MFQKFNLINEMTVKENIITPVLISKRKVNEDYIAELTDIAKANGGMIETKKAAEHGISKAMLSKLYQQEKLQRIAHGQYILPNEIEDELYAIDRRSNRIIFSHETALFLHGISDRTPFEHTVTAPTGSMPSPAIRSARGSATAS